MSIPSTNQTFVVSGEMLVATDLNTTAQEKGRIAFVDKLTPSRVLAGMRIFGTPQSRLIIDAYNSANGLAFRTASDQGTASEGGTGKKYAFEITQNYTDSSIPLEIKDPNRFQGGQEVGSRMFLVNRNGTFNTTTLANTIAEFTQNTWKPGETMQILCGQSSSSGCLWSYSTPTSSNPTSVDNYSSFTMRRSNTNQENIRLYTSGNVMMPQRLDVGTISATTYLNLPPSPAPDLLPITLDKTGGNVGINNTNPQYDLDVSGEIRCDALQTNDIVINTTVPGEGLYVSGEVVFPTLAKVSHPSVLSYDSATGKVDYMDAVSDLSPITLDPAQNRVGIHTTTPTTTLDVNGSLSTKFLQLQSIPNLSQPDVLMYDPLTKEVSYGPAPSPTPDVLPITLDKINNRVGINNTTPQHALDVVGEVNIPNTNAYRIGGLNGLSFAGSDYSAVTVGNTKAVASLAINGVAIGKLAGCAAGSVSVGRNSGTSSQGVACVAIGSYAGSNTQGQYAVAVGADAGLYTQGQYAVAVGSGAGSGTSAAGTGQGSGAIAIGRDSGQITQGASAIAIGQYAGKTSQHANSIILNATGANLNSTAASSFYVKPIRQVTDTTGFVQLYYNPSTGEIVRT
jgi:hypothetical protein